MLPQKQAEEAIVSNFSETEHETREEEKDEEQQSMFSVTNLLWHGGSAWDAWFSCASNQVPFLMPITKLSSTISSLHHFFSQ